MKGIEKPLMELFNTNSREFVIPLYQRNYSWQRAQCLRLYNDILDVKRKNRKTYFIGSIVSRLADETGDVLQIIDGQQRITTISILLLALLDVNKRGILTSSKEYTRARIQDTWLTAAFSSSGGPKSKLNLLREDKQAYDCLVQDPKLAPESSLVTQNYNFFVELIEDTAQKEGYTLEDIHDCIGKLLIVHISIEAGDDAQLIFECLNSTGLDLTEADKIRNFLLMNLSQKEQSALYKNYWNPIERHTDRDASNLIRDFLTIQTREVSNQRRLYEEFRDYYLSIRKSNEDVLAQLKTYAELYDKIRHSLIGKGDKLNTLQRQWNYLQSTVSMPFLLAYYNYAKDQAVTEEQQCEMLLVLQNYYARRVICGLPSSTLTKVFATLHSEVLKLVEKSDYEEDYNEVLKFVLLRKQGKAAYPSRVEVSEMFHRVNAYNLPRHNRNFFFERLENMQEPHKRHPALLEQLSRGDISVEHIMPQKLTGKWRADLGEENERIHDQWIHTFANLTLTGDNSSYGNRSFLEKQTGYTDSKGKWVDGLNNSPYRTAKMLANVTSWGEEEIRKRSEWLLARFFELWPDLTTSYTSPSQIVETYSFCETLEDNHYFTGRKLVAYILDGRRTESIVWKEMYEDFFKWLYVRFQKTIERSIGEFGGFLRRDLIGAIPKDYLKLSDTCYIKTAISNYDKALMIRRFMDLTNIDKTVLVLEMKVNDLPSDDDIGLTSDDEE